MKKLKRRTIVLRFYCLGVFAFGKRLLASPLLSLCPRVRFVYQAEFCEISYFEFFLKFVQACWLFLILDQKSDVLHEGVWTFISRHYCLS